MVQGNKDEKPSSVKLSHGTELCVYQKLRKLSDLTNNLKSQIVENAALSQEIPPI